MLEILRLILFWLLRILALSFTITNLVYLDPKGFWGIIATIFGLIACVNLYVWGLFCRETNKSLPGLFILFRVLQGIVVFIFDGMNLTYYVTYVLMDLIFYAIMLYDSRFKFVYREPKDERNSRIRGI